MMETTAGVIANVLKAQNLFRALSFLNLTSHMWPPPAVVNDGDTFDFVIVGGGTAGCIIASNLVKLNVNVLVVEAGGIPPFESRLPLLFQFLQNSHHDWNFTSVRNETTLRYHKDEKLQMLQGKVLGGSSTINYMFYDFGYPKDYNYWAEKTNDTRWSYENLLRLVKKTEQVINKEILNSTDVKYHGTKGPILIKKYYSKGNDGLLGAFRETGSPTVNDINPDNPTGYTNSFFTIGKGKRYSTAVSFLSPEKNNPCLKVMYNSLATKLIIDDNKRVTGVQILKPDKTLITVKTKKEVIVTAGPIKSPQLLMLSGIGPKQHLESKNIKVICDLPVGQSLQDNPTNIMVYKMEKERPMEPLDPEEFPVKVLQGQVAVNKCQDLPDYQMLTGYMDPTTFLRICGAVFNFKNDLCDRLYKGTLTRRLNFSTLVLLYSQSRGQVLLNSTNPEDYPIINPCYYCNETDLDRAAQYLKHYNAVVNTKYYKCIDGDIIAPKLDMCRGLKKDSHDFWKCFARSTLTSLHSYIGTCAIGCVVNSDLRVKDIKCLRVADASVIPKNIGAKSTATIMVVAQQLTDILVEEYNLCSK